MISIALATYNGSKYIREQIQSIQSQTIRDFEIVVSDDCSTDDTVRILKEMSDTDSRIKIYPNSKNLGFMRNFERCISLCSGEYIALCDQDDVWLPEHLEVLYKNIGDYSLICADVWMADENAKSYDVKLSYIEGIDRYPTSSMEYAWTSFYTHSWFQGASCLMRRDFVEKVTPFPTFVTYHDIWLSMTSAFLGGCTYVPTPIALYRQHGSNITFIKHSARPNKIKWFLRKIFKAERFATRKETAEYLLSKHFQSLDSEQEEFLNLFLLCNSRKNTLLGRLQNVIVELRNLRKIYSF